MRSAVSRTQLDEVTNSTLMNRISKLEGKFAIEYRIESRTITKNPMPTAWLILMNSRLSGLVQRLMKRDPSRTKSLGISASSWKVSDIVKELRLKR